MRRGGRPSALRRRAAQDDQVDSSVRRILPDAASSVFSSRQPLPWPIPFPEPAKSFPPIPPPAAAPRPPDAPRRTGHAPGRTQSGPGLRFILLLGLLDAFGPLGIDMYLPAFPRIERDLRPGAGRCS